MRFSAEPASRSIILRRPLYSGSLIIALRRFTSWSTTLRNISSSFILASAASLFLVIESSSLRVFSIDASSVLTEASNLAMLGPRLVGSAISAIAFPTSAFLAAIRFELRTIAPPTSP